MHAVSSVEKNTARARRPVNRHARHAQSSRNRLTVVQQSEIVGNDRGPFASGLEAQQQDSVAAVARQRRVHAHGSEAQQAVLGRQALAAPLAIDSMKNGGIANSIDRSDKDLLIRHRWRSSWRPVG